MASATGAATFHMVVLIFIGRTETDGGAATLINGLASRYRRDNRG